MPPSIWPEDLELRAGFGYQTLTFKNDYDGPVTATLVRNEPILKATGKPAILLHGFIDYFFQKHVAQRFNVEGYNFYGLDLRKYGRSLKGAKHPNICLDFEEYFPEITRSAFTRITRARGTSTRRSSRSRALTRITAGYERSSVRRIESAMATCASSSRCW